jgi:hypothetical protein
MMGDFNIDSTQRVFYEYHDYPSSL